MNNGDSPKQTQPARKVTAALVAAHAGVSTATVSLVANGKSSGRVSKRNEARVRESIRELGYYVDSIGSSLARGVSSLVILVAPDISNPFFAKLIAGVRGVLGEDYQLLLSVTDAGLSPSAAETRRLLGLRPAGLLVHAPTPEFLAELSSPLPMIALDAPDAPENVPSVNFDVLQGARDVAAHLAAQGHRKVGYLDANTGTATLRTRREAFLSAAAEHGMEVPADAIRSSTIEMGDAAATFSANWKQWKHAGITALACATDTHAYGVLHGASVAGVRIPQELAVTGFDDLPFSATSNPSLTSVRLDAEAVGIEAAQALRTLIEGKDLERFQLLLSSELMVRASSGGAQ
ncbi:LacI family transcriptional regulator [Arthrobacter sp. MYb211]|uniref:LacI family DNA-binding transcriptional regulator n=1 Tax=unclassified Arthrobacter TaxID=235627 RepID=UPI000CFC8660|nr:MULTISPECIES: LacI family DNA-binding transcriptional regulator [unclassified Arthrobacter]PRA10130.1 LacI family transcriptional regulator [Arthrobacter sp. MYb221]PRC05437.1 LacI family transcriptional regulator [Arthrobacter sp. MYb211]